MYVRYFVESISKFTDMDLLVVLRTDIPNKNDNSLTILNPKSFDEIKKKIFDKMTQTEKSSLIISKFVWNNSKIMVGDRIKLEVLLDNTGDISN